MSASYVLDQFWECPRCGSQFAMGAPGKAHPPTCSTAHEPTEMEQVTASRFGAKPETER